MSGTRCNCERRRLGLAHPPVCAVCGLGAPSPPHALGYVVLIMQQRLSDGSWVQVERAISRAELGRQPPGVSLLGQTVEAMFGQVAREVLVRCDRE